MNDSNSPLSSYFNRELLSACAENDLKRARDALQKGADIECKNNYGTSPLLLASAIGHLDIVKLLLEWPHKKVNVNAANITSLMQAAYNGHAEIIKVLLLAGADVNQLDSSQRNALFYIWIKSKHVNCAEILIDAGTDWKATMTMGLPYGFEGTEKEMKSFFRNILRKRKERRERARTAVLCLKRILGSRDIANLIGTLVWNDRS